MVKLNMECLLQMRQSSMVRTKLVHIWSLLDYQHSIREGICPRELNFE